MYKLCEPLFISNQISSVQRLFDNACIPFDPANTDYRNFKKAINEETAELQDADGNTMTAAEAKAYIATLP
jgi:hypothetical protein